MGDFYINAFGVTGYRIEKSEYKEKKVFVYIKHDRSNFKCSVCHNNKLTKRGTHLQHFKAGNIGQTPLIVILKRQRVFCSNCQSIGFLEVDFADSKKTYTKKFAQLVVRLLHYLSIQEVASAFRVNWNLIKRIDKEFTEQSIKSEIEEIKLVFVYRFITGGRRHNNRDLTLILDIKEGDVLAIGKGPFILNNFIKKIQTKKIELKDVSNDINIYLPGIIPPNMPTYSLPEIYYLNKIEN